MLKSAHRVNPNSLAEFLKNQEQNRITHGNEMERFLIGMHGGVARPPPSDQILRGLSYMAIGEGVLLAIIYCVLRCSGSNKQSNVADQLILRYMKGSFFLGGSLLLTAHRKEVQDLQLLPRIQSLLSACDPLLEKVGFVAGGCGTLLFAGCFGWLKGSIEISNRIGPVPKIIPPILRLAAKTYLIAGLLLIIRFRKEILDLTR